MKLNKNRHGCKDVFHAYLVENADYDGLFDIPVVKGTNQVPNKLISFSKAMTTSDYNQWVHFYEDDCQFERLWNTPRKYLKRLIKFNGIILPDFSLYRDMPLSMQIWNIYRSRAIGNWFEENGVTVMINYRVGDERTYKVAASGILEETCVSIGTVGCMDNADDERIIIESVISLTKKLHPSALIIYGKVPLKIEKYCYNRNISVIIFEGETSSYYKRKAVK